MKKNIYLFTKKFFSYLLTLYLLVTLIFFLIRITPGNPVSKYISPQLSQNMAEKVKSSFHLNDSISEQYTAFLKNIVTGEFGISYEYHRPVFDVIKEFLPFTVGFSLTSFAFQFIAGVWLALFMVKKKSALLEKGTDGAALAVYSMPTFLIGVSLVYVFSLKLNILPSADIYSTSFNELNIFGKIAEILIHSILPLITLSLPGIVVFYRYTKENIKTLRDKSFIRYLYANGVSEKEIYRRHILPNILPQLISISSVELSILLSGALITEVIYNLPGMGRLTVTAIMQRDYPLIVACTFISGLFVLVCNFAGEIARGIIDKRLIGEALS